jgi:orotate phosphoribosyltransferase
MTGDEILSLFRKSNALLRGHFELTSGLHSPQYLQCAKVLQYPEHAERLCAEIANRFRNAATDAVIAPALGGIVVGQEVGRQLGVRTMFAERQNGELVLRRGFEISRGERVLVCEDVVTTGGSVREVAGIVNRCGGTVVGMAAIVDRSGGKAFPSDFFATMTMEVVTYTKEECPLCREGLPVEKPGSRKSGPH